MTTSGTALLAPLASPARHTGVDHSTTVSLAWALPHSAVGRQLGWLVASAGHLPVPASDIRRHFDEKFLEAVSPSALNRAIASVHASGAWRIVTLDASTSPDLLVADVVARDVRVGVEIGVDDSGLIGLLYFEPSPALPKAPSTWAAIDHEASSLAPGVGFEAATISHEGRCEAANVISPETQRPLGSMFKLFVLGAVANAVKTGRISWTEEVPLTSAERSLPSGLLQVDPVGTRYTVADLAQQMIASSDNTAADMLMALVGRQAVESQTARWTTEAGTDVPFITPREFFALKYDGYPKLSSHYLSLDPAARLDYLDEIIDKIPLAQISPTSSALASPRDIDSIEWFASPSALCRTFVGLDALSRSKALAPIADALSLNDGGVQLPSARWKTVWFKGGSETGVLTLGYLAQRSNGDVSVVVLELSDSRAPLAASVTLRALAVIRGAFSLLSVE